MSDDAPDIPAFDFDPPERVKPRVRKLRLLVLLVPLAALAVVSTVFGMMMAVASDLPSLENRQEYKDAQNSVLTDVYGRPLGVLANNQHRILVTFSQIAPVMQKAVVSIEDERFWQNSGVDLKSMGRAFFQDVVQQKAAQGGSTITQQFVKNALQAQTKRTVFEKLREAALAYHLTRKWSKEKILTQYLNSIYFGNGAYGIESAAKTYFGNEPQHKDCSAPKRPCAEQLLTPEAALLAGIIQNPSGYDPVAHPQAALRRRNVVLKKMFDLKQITAATYEQARTTPLPKPAEIRPPSLDAKSPYFVSWIRQQLVDHFHARRAFEGGLKIQTTIDLDMQNAAQQAVNNYLADPDGPTASVVVIDNKTGEVRAMVGGRDYQQAPFNLATQGRRQPGSAMKPFILATALQQGIGTGSIWTSAKQDFIVPNSGGKEHFVVKNDTNTYSGSMSLGDALTYSDNTVFSQVGIEVGTKKVAKTAWKMGIRTPISTNYAMTLGGLTTGVSPLDMAHAYETIANGGDRVNGTLGAPDGGPVGVRRVTVAKTGELVERNKTIDKRVLTPEIAQEMTSAMQNVVFSGTAQRAQLPNGELAAGKTGTTSDNSDAWFVGFNERYTVAVWVGFPDSNRSMSNYFEGGDVEGGTFPALIWHDFMIAANAIDARHDAARAKREGKPLPEGTDTTGEGDGTSDVPAPDTSGSGGASEGSGGGGDTGDGTTGDSGGKTGGGTGGTGDTGGGTGGTGDTGGGTGDTGGGGGTGDAGGGTGDTGGGGGGTGDAGGGAGGDAGGATGGATGGAGAPTG